MRKMISISGVSFAALLAMGALAGITPAAANPAQDRVISNFCDGHPDASECNDWRYNRASWSDGQYQSFYMSHRDQAEFDTAEATAAFSGETSSVPPPNPDATATETRIAPGYSEASKAVVNTPGTVVSTPTGEVAKTVPEVTGDSPTHIADCQATFKSYDAASDSYMGLDGARHQCKL